MWGDTQMLIKIKKNLHGLFSHQKTPFNPFGVKHIGKKFFLNHPIVQCRSDKEKIRLGSSVKRQVIINI